MKIGSRIIPFVLMVIAVMVAVAQPIGQGSSGEIMTQMDDRGTDKGKQLWQGEPVDSLI